MQTNELRVANSAGGHQFPIVDDSTGQDIALVYNRNEDSRKTAQLLAAAPELLEALKGLIDFVHDLENGNIPNKELYYNSIEAIQKATNL